MLHLDQIGGVCHDLVDVLVRIGDLVDPLLPVPVLDAAHPLGEIVGREALARLGTGEPAARTVRRRAESGGVALAAEM
jgi:hypothetical protein